MHMAIACQTDQKFEKFHMTPDVSELVSRVVAGDGASGDGVAGDGVAGDGVAGDGVAGDGAAGVFAGVDAAVPFCGCTNL
jgi:hypothetical protein